MEKMPIWYVIMTYDPQVYQFQIWRVLKSIPCTLGDVERMHKEYVAPLYAQSNRPYSTMIIERTEDNPLTVEKEG